MRVHIPQHVIGRAILAAQQDLVHEVVGFFVINPGKIHVHGHTQGEGGATRIDPYVEWRKCTNSHPEPYANARVEAEEMAQIIVDQSLQPIAMFHSHPSGENEPSAHDREFFPVSYVDVCYIWTDSMPSFLTQYTPNMTAVEVPINGVFLSVQ